MVNAPTTAAERAEEIRDLRSQLDGLQREDQQEIIFRDISKRPPKVPVWSMRTGREVRIPQHLLEQTLRKRDHLTREYLFTGNKDRAPEFRPGTIKCFLAADSPDRALLDEIGLAGMTCRKVNLVSEYAARQHAEHRHSAEWALRQEAQQKHERERFEARQEEATAATLKLAEAASGKARKAAD